MPFIYKSTGSWGLPEIAMALNYRRKSSQEIAAEVHARYRGHSTDISVSFEQMLRLISY
jgi:hypothetical protein